MIALGTSLKGSSKVAGGQRSATPGTGYYPAHSTLKGSFWVAVLSLIPPALADELFVPTEFPTIQAAIDAASPGDEVIISPGTYSGFGNRNLDFQGKAIGVRSIDPSDPKTVEATVIDPQGDPNRPNRRGFVFQTGEGPNSILDGLTITHGWGDYGGGVACLDASPTIRRCAIKANSADLGGGVYLRNSHAGIEVCMVLENRARGGGGIRSDSGNPKVTNCLFIANAATDGGGGGIEGANFDAVNCLFTVNSATQGGGGINASYPSVINCTIFANSASWGGGVASSGLVTNSILWGNQAPGGAQVNSGGFLRVEWSNVMAGRAGTSGNPAWFYNIDAEPLFANPTAGNFRLQGGSPCIDVGDNMAVPTGVVTDLGGGSRFLDDPNTPDNGSDSPPPIVDLGAYEFSGASPSLPDQDKDGVPDEQDRCPNTILLVGVDASGCPLEVPGDLDRDGDVDLQDFAILQRCLDEPDMPVKPDCAGG